MKRLILLAAFVVASALSQTSGTVTAIAPAPGGFKASAGSVSCTVMGNTSAPATAAVIDCTVGPNKLPTATIPLPAGSGYTFQQNWGVDPATKTAGDAVIVILVADSAGKITWQATATPNNGGQSASGNGSF